MSFVHFAVAALSALKRDRRANRGELATVQQERLRQLIIHAANRVPFYQDRYRHINPTSCSLSDLPPVEKGEFLTGFQDTVTDRAVSLDEVLAASDAHQDGMPWIRNEYLVSQTSGSTGDTVYFINDRKAWDIQRGAVFARTMRDRLTVRDASRFTFGRRYRMAFLVSEGRTCISTQTAYEALASSGIVTNVKLFSVLDNLENIVEQLNSFRPHYLHSFPTCLEMLAHEKLSGSARFNPEFISTSSEALTPGARRALHQAFPQATVTQQYGSTECIVLANECAQGRMHLNSDYSILEPVDEHDQPVAVGELSHHCLLTNLINHTQPIIRYRLTDSLELTGEECPCGRPMPVVKISGRTDDIIWLHDRHGKFKPHPAYTFCLVIIDCPGVAQWQLIHERQNQLHLRVVRQRNAEPESVIRQLRSALDNYFAGHGDGDAVTLKISCVDQLERSESSGKLKQIISHVAPPCPSNATRHGKQADAA